MCPHIAALSKLNLPQTKWIELDFGHLIQPGDL